VARSRWATLAVAALLCLSACTSGPSSGGAAHPTPSAAPTPQFRSYAALGDSYTAGPFIPTTDLAGGCFRSDHDYPALLARRLHVERLRDVSCSAATTRDLARPQHTFQGAKVPAQLHAVRPDTDLVTLGIGGNDFGLFGTLIQTCTFLRATDPGGAPCARTLLQRRPHLFADIRRTGARLTRALTEIEQRAPRATVVLVGYLRLAPEHGSCARLPLAAGDYRVANRVSRALDHAMHRAAARAHASYVDMDAISVGHDVCSAHPWVNGSRTIRGKAFAYHPLESGMRGVAAAIAARLPTSATQ
jgi:lysophospholipase L1-like esterase